MMESPFQIVLNNSLVALRLSKGAHQSVTRSIKPIGLGKKNYLFAGSEGGAETWATLASLINSAKLHDIDPRHYLTDVLERIVSGRTKINQLNTLLPWNWKAERHGSEPKLAA